ncbi:MAG: EAL domain-containing protein [Hyphomicrobiales bacterium]
MIGLHPEDSREFARARYVTLAKQLPLLYLGVLINTVAVAANYYGHAPTILLVIAIVPFVIFAAERLYYWLRLDPGLADDKRVGEELRRVTIVSSAVSVVYSGWMVALFAFSDPTRFIFLSLFTFVWTVNAAYTLSAVPHAAIFIIGAMSLPLISGVAAHGEMVYLVAALQFTFTAILTVHIVRTNYNGLAVLTAARREVEEKREQAEASRQRISDLAFRDPLTGLANRRSFEIHLDGITAGRFAKEEPFAVAIIDLDGFKPINDVYGHRAGDAVLREAGARMTAVLGEKDVIARLGGDEFGAILPQARTFADAEALGWRICEALREPFRVDGREARLSGSCGIALFPDAGRDPDTLMAHADNALYTSKDVARGGVTLYSESIEQTIRHRARIEQALRRAINDDAIEVYFQPIFRLSTLDVLGFEALARWRDEDLGRVSPAEFIPIAEEAGIISDLTDLLLRKAAAYAAVWPSSVVLSFNISAVELVRPTTGLRILSALGREGLSPNRLEIEITETALMSDYEATRPNIEQLRDAGVRIALDDFGTGHSSFAHLQRIGIDRLKIDRSFTSALIRDRRTQAIVKAIADMCAGLEIECLAEGIENQHQIAALKRYGCGLGQGYLLGVPMSADDALVFLDAHFADRPDVALVGARARRLR